MSSDTINQLIKEEYVMKKFVCMSIFCVSLVPVAASATLTHSFSDNTIYMPSWVSSDTSDNDRDTIGYPDITGGQLSLDGNRLVGVRFNLDRRYSGFGDLFIDKDDNGYYDYVLNNATGTIYGFDDNVLSSTRGMNDHLFLTSDDYLSRANVEYREDHFVAINLSNVNELTESGQASILGSFDSDLYRLGRRQGMAYSFTELTSDLEMGGTFNLNFAPICANDVISASGNTVVPIPGTFALLAGGLFGLAGIRRKAKK